MAIKSIEAQIVSLLKNNNSKNIIFNNSKGSIGSNSIALGTAISPNELEKQAKNLKDILVKNIKILVKDNYYSQVIIESIEVNIVSNSEIEIMFNEKLGTMDSDFESYNTADIGAFIPIMLNEGFSVKNPKTKFFGVYRHSTQFIEASIKEFKNKNKNEYINIDVSKKWDEQYSKYNHLIEEYTFY